MLNITSPQNTSFERIVAETKWHGSADSLRVWHDIGCLVTVDINDKLQGLVVFSSQEADQWVVYPPASLDEAAERQGIARKGVFNSDMGAKGPGFAAANTPEAWQHSGDGLVDVVARGVLLRSSDAVHVKAESADNALTLAGRYIRHGFLYLGARIMDEATSSLSGTNKMIERVTKDYGDAQAVVMSAPPSWQLKQHRQQLQHDVPPKKVLIRDRKYAAKSTLQVLGSFSADNLQREAS